MNIGEFGIYGWQIVKVFSLKFMYSFAIIRPFVKPFSCKKTKWLNSLMFYNANVFHYAVSHSLYPLMKINGQYICNCWSFSLISLIFVRNYIGNLIFAMGMSHLVDI